MSQLISIAERIKVINTIQKTAHAMQLISMSTLSRINAKKKTLDAYTHQLELISHELHVSGAASHLTHDSKKIYLIISSQKGFCGGFNNKLFSFIKELKNKSSETLTCITVGPYASHFCKNEGMNTIDQSITYSLATIAEQSELIFKKLIGVKNAYDHVVVINNKSASIFIQKPHETIIPLKQNYHVNNSHLPEAYTLEQSYEEIRKAIFCMQLKTKISQLLLESLQAENGARALSMDSSARNAKNLLSEMRLAYNKIRQAKVTKELTELSSALID